jgi:hypothetical protein
MADREQARPGQILQQKRRVRCLKAYSDVHGKQHTRVFLECAAQRRHSDTRQQRAQIGSSIDMSCHDVLRDTNSHHTLASLRRRASPPSPEMLRSMGRLSRTHVASTRRGCALRVVAGMSAVSVMHDALAHRHGCRAPIKTASPASCQAQVLLLLRRISARIVCTMLCLGMGMFHQRRTAGCQATP